MVCHVLCLWFLHLHSSSQPMISYGSGWRWIQWWISSPSRLCLCLCIWTGAGWVKHSPITDTLPLFNTWLFHQIMTRGCQKCKTHRQILLDKGLHRHLLDIKHISLNLSVNTICYTQSVTANQLSAARWDLWSLTCWELERRSLEILLLFKMADCLFSCIIFEVFWGHEQLRSLLNLWIIKYSRNHSAAQKQTGSLTIVQWMKQDTDAIHWSDRQYSFNEACLINHTFTGLFVI